MELEANIICLREKEKQLTAKVKQADEMTGQLRRCEETLAQEKQLGVEKDGQIRALGEKLDAKMEEANKLLEANRDLTSRVDQLELVVEDAKLAKCDNAHEMEAVGVVEEKLKQLEAEFASYRDDCDRQAADRQKEVSSLRAENASCQAIVDSRSADFEEKMSCLCAENISYEETINMLKTDFEEQVSSLKLENNSYTDTIERMKVDFEEKLSCLQTEKASYQDIKTALEDKVSHLESEVRRLESTNEGLISELNELTEEMKRRGERIAKLEVDLAERLRRTDETVRLGQDLQVRLTAAEQERSEAVEKVAEVNEELEARLEDLEQERRQVATHVKEIDKLDYELATCRQKFSDTEAKMQAAEKTHLDRIEAITVRNNELMTMTEVLQKSTVVANIELEKSKEELAAGQEQLQQAQKDKSGLVEQMDLDKERLLCLQQDVQDRDSRIVELEAELKSFLDCKEERSEQISLINATNTDGESEESEAVVPCLACLSQQTEAKRLADELYEAKVQVTRLSGVLKGKEDEIQELTKKLQIRSDELVEVSSELEQFRLSEEKKLELQQAVDTASRQINQLTENIAEAVKEKESADSRLVEVEKAIAHLRSELETGRLEEEKNCGMRAEHKTMKETLRDLEAELRYRSDDCTRLEAEVRTKTDRIQQLEVAVSEAGKLAATTIEQGKKTKQELSASLEAAKQRSEELEREMARQSGTEQHDDSRSEAMSTSTVSKAEEISRMKDIEDSFEDRYAKLKLVAIKLKKKVADQSKIMEDLESRAKFSKPQADPEPANGQLKDKLAAMTNNFSRLQAEYDQAMDRVEQLEGSVKALTKDLEASLTESMANKQKAEEAGQTASVAKADAALATEQLKEKEAEAAALAVTVGQEREERRGLEERLRQAQGLEANLREQAAQGLATGETAAALRLQVEQLELTLTKEQERATRAQESLASTRTSLTQVSKIINS